MTSRAGRRAWTGRHSSPRQGWPGRKRSSPGSPPPSPAWPRWSRPQPLETWKDYLRFHVVDGFADVLPRAFAEQAMAMRSAVTDQPQPSSRAQRALETTQVAMSDALGRMYAERYFPAEQKARVETIVGNVIAAFRRRVESATWMSPGTRTQALAKLKTLYFGIGYPETVAGLFRPGRGQRGRRGQPAAGRGPQLPPCPGSAGPARGPDRMVDRAADGRCRPRVPAERVQLSRRAAAGAQVRPDRVGRRELRGHRRHRRPRGQSLRGHAGRGMGRGRPDAPLVDPGGPVAVPGSGRRHW